ncbi:MAG: ATP-dependent DNA helicase UvrD2 [Actinomycetia bacterium]|nr:ATP-dependent DNA helicase UvrD2 [Actinomycetes bacterium]MCH9800940.1 ATP-dependent DNA helicase UvrD2 [Actinomycetes bacterium]
MSDPAEILNGLNPEQREAATAHDGPVLIVAGPGSGKTRTVTRRLAYGVRTGAIESHRAMALTFTARAAGEVGGRLAALGVTGVAARTFHAAALRQLRHFWGEVIGGEPARLVGDRSVLLGQAIKRAGTDIPPELLGEELDWARARCIDPADYAAAAAGMQRDPVSIDPGSIAQAMSAYEEAKSAAGVIDFADVLLITIGMLQSRSDVRESVRRQYRWFTVDEYQDVSPLQQRLLDLWLGDRGQLCAVGDPAQAIYGFAGADATLIASFPQRYPGATVVRLPTTYRCAPQIVEVANTVGAGIPRATQLRPDTSDRAGSVQVLQYPSDAAEAAGVAAEIEVLGAGGHDYREMAVLFRTNAQARPVGEALRARGIPYAVYGSERFFDRAEVREAITRIRGELRTGPAKSAAECWQEVATAMAHGSEPVDGAAGRKRWESLAALAGLVPQIGTGAELVAELERRGADRDPPRPPGVSLLTLHSAKGLEWDTVFLIGAWDGMLPLSAVNAEELEEERRLVYVGVTRPRHRLMITWGAAGRPAGRRRISPLLDRIAPVGTPADAVLDLSDRVTPAGMDSRAGEQRPPARCRVCGSALVTGIERGLGRCRSCPGNADELLLAQLEQWRRLTAIALGVPSYAVLSSTALQGISETLPQDAAALAQIPGMNTDRMTRYADDLLGMVQAVGTQTPEPPSR